MVGEAMRAGTHHGLLKPFLGRALVWFLGGGKGSPGNVGSVHCVLTEAFVPPHWRAFKYIFRHTHTYCIWVFTHCVCANEPLEYYPQIGKRAVMHVLACSASCQGMSFVCFLS